jgi:hypothetical protein
MDAQQQTIAFAGTGIVECRLIPRSSIPRIRGCTYCPGAPVRRLSEKCRLKGLSIATLDWLDKMSLWYLHLNWISQCAVLIA